LRNAQGEIIALLGVTRDVTEKKQSDQLIWKQANFDLLTELPNRFMFYDRLSQEIRKAQRENQPLALLFIDLDRFKEVNDTLGHQVGDVLLVEAARRIAGMRAPIRYSGASGRRRIYGGAVALAG
jgi:FOG: GGDEF domain